MSTKLTYRAAEYRGQTKLIVFSRSKLLTFILLALAIGFFASPLDYAQSSRGADTTSAWQIGLNYGSANLFLLLIPTAGLECEIGYFSTKREEQSSSFDAGIRFVLNTGYVLPTDAPEFTYVDYTMLLSAIIRAGKQSFALLSGLTYRDWGDLRYKTGIRFSSGVEWSYPLIDNRMMLLFRAVAAIRPEGSIEYGPIGVGIAIGWFKY